MLIYATHFTLAADETFDGVLQHAAKWLDRKLDVKVDAARLLTTDSVNSGVQKLETASFVDGSPSLVGFRLTHPDRSVSGREWITEFGLRRDNEGGEIHCTVVLRTAEVSIRVSRLPQVSRPNLVGDIVMKAKPGQLCPGRAIKRLTDGDAARAFEVSVLDERRQHPLVVVSPAPDDSYLIDPKRLRSLLAGLADVVQIPVGSDTFEIAEHAGRQFAAWRGAVNIIFPRRRTDPEKWAPCVRLMPDELRAIANDAGDTASEVLAVITHRLNLRRSWEHTSIEGIRRAETTRRLDELRAAGNENSEHAEEVELLWEVNGELEAQVGSLQDEVHALRTDLDAKEDEARTQQYEMNSLKAALAGVSSASDGVDTNGLRDAVGALAKGQPSLEQSLTLVNALFSDRVEILPTAWSSARDAELFREKRQKAFELIWKLCTEYWEAVRRGGDNEAKGVFTDACYSARESEQVEKNRRAVELRTFQYRGESIEMMRHLKIGVKDSIATTFRLHFSWEPNEERIIIGHCGCHLDHS